jgi:hypothetical protein
MKVGHSTLHLPNSLGSQNTNKMKILSKKEQDLKFVNQSKWVIIISYAKREVIKWSVDNHLLSCQLLISYKLFKIK